MVKPQSLTVRLALKWAGLLALFSGWLFASTAWAACSPWLGRAQLNEYYFGSTVNNFIEVYSADANFPSSWQNWTLHIYDGKTTSTYTLESTATQQCLGAGLDKGKTYLVKDFGTLANTQSFIELRDANGLLVDGFIFDNKSTSSLWDTTKQAAWNTECPAMKSQMDSQYTLSSILSSQLNMLNKSNSSIKDLARYPNGTGIWDLARGQGSSTGYTHCLNNSGSIIDTVNTITASSNGSFTFTITATATGMASTTADVTITDSLSSVTGSPTSNLSCSVSSVSSGSVTPGSGTGPWTWLIHGLGALQTASMNLVCTASNASSGTVYKNTATSPAGSGYVNTQTDWSQVLIVGATTPPPPPQPFSYLISHPTGTGQVCAPNTLTIKACADPTCSSLFTSGATGTLTSSGGTVSWPSGASFTIGSSGVTTVNMQISSAGTPVSFGISPTPTSLATPYCDFGSPNCTFTTSTCGFDAVEQGGSPGSHIYTKLAGTPFNLDIVALGTGNTVNSTFTGSVDVSLVDVCPSTGGSPLTTPQTITFAAADSGRKNVANFNYANAAANVKVRMLFNSTVETCSTDGFAIRPSAATLSTVETMASSGAASATPTFKTGAQFNLKATTSPTNYGGTLALDTSKLAAHSGGVLGSLTAASLIANGGNAAASYSEVGYLTFNPGAYRDDSFTAVDNAVGDCITDTTSNNYLSTTAIGGKYGCSIGNTAALTIGRFTPDHFAVTPGSATAGCGGAFTYFGQDGITTPFSLTAQNSSNQKTQNYTGSFARLTLTDWTAFRFTPAAAYPLPTGASLATSATPPSGSWSNGQASVTARHLVTRPTATDTLLASLSADTAVLVNAQPLDSDGVTMTSATAVQSLSTPFRYGRVQLTNAIGSELLDLAVSMKAQYWGGGSSGWKTNTSDTCTATTLSLGNADGSAYTGATCVWDSGVGTGNSGKGCTSLAQNGKQYKEAGVSGFAGDFNLWLKAPLTPGDVYVTAVVPSWMQYNWTGSVANPVARASFGSKAPGGGAPTKTSGAVIYRREMF